MCDKDKPTIHNIIVVTSPLPNTDEVATQRVRSLRAISGAQSFIYACYIHVFHSHDNTKVGLITLQTDKQRQCTIIIHNVYNIQDYDQLVFLLASTGTAPPIIFFRCLIMWTIQLRENYNYEMMSHMYHYNKVSRNYLRGM